MHKSNLWVETICVSLTQIFKKRIKSMGLIKFVSMSLSCRQLSPYLSSRPCSPMWPSYWLSAKNSRNNNFNEQIN